MGCASSHQSDQLGPNGLPRPLASDQSLFRVKYSSTLQGKPETVDSIVAAIMETSLKNNQFHNITGMMFFTRASNGVVQILEGPKYDVIILTNKIFADPRHTDCVLLESKNISTRAHSNFGMALARLENSEAVYDGHLIRIQYSSNLCAENLDDARRQISNILAQSARNNPSRNIGGLLCFNPTTMEVMQILEGPASAVRELFTMIMVDSRHTNCCLTSEELLLSDDEYLFESKWGLLQTETQRHNVFDLSARIRAAFKDQTANKGLPINVVLRNVLSPSQRDSFTTPTAHEITTAVKESS